MSLGIPHLVGWDGAHMFGIVCSDDICELWLVSQSVSKTSVLHCVKDKSCQIFDNTTWSNTGHGIKSPTIVIVMCDTDFLM